MWRRQFYIQSNKNVFIKTVWLFSSLLSLPYWCALHSKRDTHFAQFTQAGLPATLTFSTLFCLSDEKCNPIGSSAMSWLAPCQSSLCPSPFFSMSVGKNKRWGCRRWLLIRWHLNTRWFLLSPLCPCVSEQNTEHKLIPLCKPGASACTSVEGSTHAGLAWTLLSSASHVTAFGFPWIPLTVSCVSVLYSSHHELCFPLSPHASIHLPKESHSYSRRLQLLHSVFPVVWMSAKMWVKVLGSPVFSEGSVCQAIGSAAQLPENWPFHVPSEYFELRKDRHTERGE